PCGRDERRTGEDQRADQQHPLGIAFTSKEKVVPVVPCEQQARPFLGIVCILYDAVALPCLERRGASF
ncbi:hypothetical protein, partial [Pontibacter sp. HJ8]